MPARIAASIFDEPLEGVRLLRRLRGGARERDLRLIRLFRRFPYAMLIAVVARPPPLAALNASLSSFFELADREFNMEIGFIATCAACATCGIASLTLCAPP